MAKVCVVQVVYNNKRFIEPVFSSIFAQTFKDIHVVAVIAGNEDGGKELLQEKFPQVEIIDPGYNIGFAKGHNLVFNPISLKATSDLREEGSTEPEFFQLVNPDLILDPDYIEKMLKAFEDTKVGAATGKLYKISNEKFQILNERFNAEKLTFKILDTTGVIINRSGRARDRGQHEADKGQYDKLINIDAVSAAGAMYRKEALENVKLQIPNAKEYFDEDFHSYWEDVDLAWRMKNKGWKNVFVPEAVGYHGRGAGSSKKGYVDVLGFIKHHKQISPRVRQLNYKNHIFMYMKNSKWFYPQFFIREFFMLIYILLFEWSTLKVIPELIKSVPKMLRKRKEIKKIALIL
jgi:GT2 family glycosyltransferase